MLRATDLAHLIVRSRLAPGAIAVDATVGNGHDTAFLADIVGASGHVYGFDVQAEALAVATERVRGLAQVSLLHAGHETMAAKIPAFALQRLSAVMFNLGYLPGAAKSVVTRTETTLAALQQALDHLAVGGVVTVITYPGHAEGADEAVAVAQYTAMLPATFAASTFQRVNSAGAAPALTVVERVK